MTNPEVNCRKPWHLDLGEDSVIHCMHKFPDINSSPFKVFSCRILTRTCMGGFTQYGNAIATKESLEQSFNLNLKKKCQRKLFANKQKN